MDRRGRGRGLHRFCQDERCGTKVEGAVMEETLMYTDIRYVGII
jgi:hypothetical protein